MNANSILSQVQVRDIGTLDLLATLGVAFGISLFIVFVYRISHRGLTFERSFLTSLLMLSPIVGLVMLLIGSNLALSLGLVGALSIIRFRNVLKDSRDMVYLFWAIAVGLGCGTYNWEVAIIASIFIGGILLIIHFLRFNSESRLETVLVVCGTGEQQGDKIREIIQQYCSGMELRSIEVRENDWEIVFEIKISSGDYQNSDTLIAEIRKLSGVERTSLLAPQLSFPQ